MKRVKRKVLRRTDSQSDDEFEEYVTKYCKWLRADPERRLRRGFLEDEKPTGAIRTAAVRSGKREPRLLCSFKGKRKAVLTITYQR